MLAIELQRPTRNRNTKAVGCRIKNSDLEPIQKIVDESFNGNFSLLMRTALDEYITKLQGQIND